MPDQPHQTGRRAAGADNRNGSYSGLYHVRIVDRNGHAHDFPAARIDNRITLTDAEGNVLGSWSEGEWSRFEFCGVGHDFDRVHPDKLRYRRNE